MESNLARVLRNHADHNRKTLEHILPLCQFEPAVMVDMFPGPALILDHTMAIRHHNVFGKSLLKPFQERDVFLQSLASRCLANGCPDMQKITLNNSDGMRHYDLYAFPLHQKDSAQKENTPAEESLVFLFGRETTIEHNLTNALVDSRQMFKDLVSCSTDFAWETDDKGRFIYVSPKGILGYTAFELNGKNVQEMIVDGAAGNPFIVRDKASDVELWLKRADGTLACLLVSAVPVLDGRAEWQGARGICRDITAMREKELILRHVYKRDYICSRIVAAIRDITDPAEMVEKLLSLTQEGIYADGGCLVQKISLPDGGFKANILYHSDAVFNEPLMVFLCDKAMASWPKTAANEQKIDIFSHKNYQIMMGLTRYHGVDNGAFFLVREKPTNWTEEDRRLFTAITGHFGLALQQLCRIG